MENIEGKALDLAALMELNERRRPGIRAIAERLLAQHPEWGAERLAAHAKVQWHVADDERQRDAVNPRPHQMAPERYEKAYQRPWPFGRKP